MGEKPRNKDKEKKSPKAAKPGVRPHEQRQQGVTFKSSEPVPKPPADRKSS